MTSFLSDLDSIFGSDLQEERFSHKLFYAKYIAVSTVSSWMQRAK